MMCYQEAMDKNILEDIRPNVKALWNDALLKTDDDSPQLSEETLEMFCALAMKGVLLVKKSWTRLGARFWICVFKI